MCTAGACFLNPLTACSALCTSLGVRGCGSPQPLALCVLGLSEPQKSFLLNSSFRNVKTRISINHISTTLLCRVHSVCGFPCTPHSSIRLECQSTGRLLELFPRIRNKSESHQPQPRAVQLTARARSTSCVSFEETSFFSPEDCTSEKDDCTQGYEAKWQ